MNKYLTIFSTSIKEEKKKMSNTLISMFSFCVIVIIFNQLWTYIYTKGARQIIEGYTLNMMLWYLIMAETLTFCLSTKQITRSFAEDIKSGKIAYLLNKPYNYYLYKVFSNLANSVWKMIFIIPTALLIGGILLKDFNTINLYSILPLILVVFTTCILSIAIYGVIGLIAFWIEEPTPFTWILQKFILLLGLFFPPEFFPSWLQPFIIYSPIYSLMSGPCKLLANFSFELFGQVLLSQGIYLIIFVLLGFLIYAKGTRKVNINGG